MLPPEMKAGLGQVAVSKPRCNAQQASAVTEYPQSRQNGNRNAHGADRESAMPAAMPDRSGLEGAVGASEGQRWVNCRKVAYRDSEGRKWGYRGKRARVLDMLVASPGGITQWDTLPWHTRLGASIHAMREDGLAITTELEGPYRHARYRLATRLVASINNPDKSSGGHVG
jgi:hypothetical protein